MCLEKNDKEESAKKLTLWAMHSLAFLHIKNLRCLCILEVVGLLKGRQTTSYHGKRTSAGSISVFNVLYCWGKCLNVGSKASSGKEQAILKGQAD